MQTTCPICGRVDDPEEYIIDSPIRKIMEEKEVCFHCAFWYNISKKDSDIKNPFVPVVVNYTHWSFPSEEPVHIKESNFWSWRPIPTMHYILFEDGRIAKTNQLWHQGTVPKEFHKLIPNNAVFISEPEFEQIVEHISNKGKAPIESTCPQPLLNFLLKNYEFTK